jgi:Tfp pilus assembly protein PilO
MGARGRLIGCAVVALVVVAAVWTLVVSPERSQSAGLAAQISTARSTLVSEQGQIAAGEQARAKYAAALHAVKLLETAVPLSDEVPQLIRLINGLETGHKISWTTTSIGGGGTGAAGLTSVDWSFSFGATYSNLQSFVTAIDALTATDGTNVMTKGRLFTVNSISLSPSGVSGKSLSASVNMTVYQLPAGVSATSSPGVTTTTAAP